MKRTTLGALAAFVVLGFMVWMQVGQQQERGISRISLESLDIDALDRIELSRQNTLALKRVADVWKLANGRDADLATVNTLLTIVSNIRSSERITADEERFADYEVDKSQGIAFEGFVGDESEVFFVIGRDSTRGSYLLYDGAVYLVANFSRFPFARADADWLEKRVFRLDASEITRVELQSAEDFGYVLEHDPNQGWRLADGVKTPESYRFDVQKAAALPSAIANLRLEQFVDPNANAVEFSENADRLLVTAKESQYELVVGPETEAGSFYAQLASSPEDIFEIPAQSKHSAVKTLDAFRDLTLIELNPADVVALELVKEKRKLVFKRGDAGWELASSSEKVPEDFELDPTAIDRRLTSLGRAIAMQLVPNTSEKAAGFSKPYATVKAIASDGSEAQLTIGAELETGDVKTRYAQGNKDPLIYMITGYLTETLVAGLDSFKKSEQPSGSAGITPEALQQLPPEIREAVMERLRQEQGQP